MEPGLIDRWTGSFRVDSLGRHEYTIEGWVDRFRTWLRDLSKKVDAGQDVASELLEGAELVQQAAGRASGAEADWLRRRAGVLKGQEDQAAQRPGRARPPARRGDGALPRSPRRPDL